MDLPEFDLIVCGVPRFAAEAPWAWRLLSRYLRRLPARRRTEAAGRLPTVSEIPGDSELVLVDSDPEAYVLPEVGERLIRALDSGEGFELILPVSNEPWAEEARRDPPFQYATPTGLCEAVAAIASSGGPIRPAEAPSSPVFAIRRRALRVLPADTLLDRVPEAAHSHGLRAAVDPGAYVHRYGAMDASPRGDLAARVPPAARRVLDVGCARGATGPLLRARGVELLVGIEPDGEDAAAASRLYDEIHRGRLEDVVEALRGPFDAVLFGDVLEHLEDPSDALVRVRAHLSADGVVIASVPNAGHWSILDDLLRGRFDYVPYSILSGTHLRLFTRRTLEDLFSASGYRVRRLDTVALPAHPGAAARLAQLRSVPGASEDLEVAEFLAVAEPTFTTDK